MLNSLTKLAVEANGVIALRMMKLMFGGRRAARREARLMVSEKIDTAVRNVFRKYAFEEAKGEKDELVFQRPGTFMNIGKKLPACEAPAKTSQPNVPLVVARSLLITWALVPHAIG